MSGRDRDALRLAAATPTSRAMTWAERMEGEARNLTTGEAAAMRRGFAYGVQAGRAASQEPAP